jgi:preprotein translocase subunit SecB
MSNNVKVLIQYLKESSFKVENTPHVFLENQGKPDISISVDLDVKKISEKDDIKVFENTVKITAEAKNKNKKVFTCEVAYAGIFTIADLEEKMLEQILLIYCPNLLFPYLRQIVSNMVSAGGFPPLMLEPIDFAALYAKRKNVEDSEPISNTKN